MDMFDGCKAKNRKIAANIESFVTSILNEVNTNKRSKVFINERCDEVKIVPVDFDTHYLILKVDERKNASVLRHSLPLDNEHFKPMGTLQMYAAAFFELLHSLDDFYRQMDTVDQLTCVVDPQEISTKHDYRIIRLENRVYMKIKVNPLDPTFLVTTFYGPTRLVEKYRTIYSEKVNDWNADDDIHGNFLKIFGLMSFPQRAQFQNTGMIEYCSICYVERVANQIPIVSCDNEKCSLIFHTMCLQEWFSALRDTKTFLNMTSGRCPSCKEKLSTAFDSLLEQ